MILIFKHLFYRNYVGLSLWPFIILKDDALKKSELLILPFYLFYILEWLIRTILYLDRYRAYQNISFEREAYANEKNPKYLAERRPFSFLDYLVR